jgi:hypothetical protein
MTPSIARQTAIAAFAGCALAFTVAGQENQRQIERVLRSVEGGGTFTPTIDTGLTLWERAQFDYGGSLAFSYLTLDQAGGNSVRLLQPEATVFGRLNIDGVHSVFARAQFTYRDFSDGDSFDGRGDRWVQPFPDRYWYEFDLRRAMDVYQQTDIDHNVNIRVGRQFLDWGSGLAFSEALYAARPIFEFDKRNRAELLVGVTPNHTADFDSSRMNYDTKTERVYYGALLAHVFDGGDELYGFALGMDDHNNEDRSAEGGLTGVNFERDSIYFGLGARGTIGQSWLYLVEGVYQYGDSASDPLLGVQTIEDLRAWAARAQFTYVFRDENESRFQAELLIASGDSDRLSNTNTVAGNTPGTDDNGFNSLGYAFTGVAFAPTLSNLVSVRAGLATMPLRSDEDYRDLQLGCDLIVSFKYDSDAPIDEPTTHNGFLGTEFDVYANWRISSDLAVTARYGVFFPGTAIPEPDDIRNFFYVGVTLSF